MITISSTTISVDGTTVQINFSDCMQGDKTGFVLHTTGAAVTLANITNDIQRLNPGALILTISRPIYGTEVLTLDYASGIIRDGSNLLMLTATGKTVTNNATTTTTTT